MKKKLIQDVNVSDYLKMDGKELRRRVVSKTTNSDTSITLTYDIDPDDNPTDDFYDTNQQIVRIQDAKGEAVRKGATGVKWGLRAYTEAASFYFGGPIYKLGGDALLLLGGKGIELLQRAEKLRVVVGQVSKVLASTQSILPRLRAKLATLTQGSDEALQLTRQIDEMEEVARKAQAGLDEATDVLKHADDLAKQTQEAVAFAQQGNNRFNSDDVALGVFEHLQAFKGQAQTGSDFPVQPGDFWATLQKGIDDCVARGNRIHFNLDGFSVTDALNPLSSKYGSYTSQEFRYIRANYPYASIFYRNGCVVPMP